MYSNLYIHIPKNFANPELDKRVLGNVVDFFTNIDMDDIEESKDLLGRTYEYCIAQFASHEGKGGGEFYTPACVVQTIVEVLKPFACCCAALRCKAVAARFLWTS